MGAEMNNTTPLFLKSMKTYAAQAYNQVFFSEADSGYTFEQLITNNLNLTGTELRYLHELLEPLPDPLPTNYFEDIQSAVLGSSMKDKEKDILLAAVSVAIASRSYWEDASTNPLNPWYSDWGPTIQNKLNNTNRADYSVLLLFATPVALFTAIVYMQEGMSHELSLAARLGLLFAGIAAAAASAIHVFWGP